MLYDKDIREPLFDFLEETYGKIRIIEEKQMGRSRADVVMVLPKALCGLEIKSDADTYARLGRQVRDYDQYFDYNYIVAGTKHAGHVKEHVPDWWGILTVELEEGRPDFYLWRKPKENPKVNWKRKMGLLWRPELVHIQERNHLPKYRQKSKEFVIDKILLKVPREQLYQQISDELFERDYTQIRQDIAAYKKELLLK
ncbi:MAG: sce7726 family protein [Lachnospiraceae bacterium]|nr:sce7726 family protein [Lachnospiraceae bacterium]